MLTQFTDTYASTYLDKLKYLLVIKGYVEMHST